MKHLRLLVLLPGLVLGACSARTPNPVDSASSLGGQGSSVCPTGRKFAGSGECIVNFGAQCKLEGVAFSPYAKGQSPLANTVVSAAQIQARLELIADATRGIRVYSTQNGLAATCRMARELGLGFDQGIWLGSDTAANDREIGGFVEIARTCQMDFVIIGNEALWRKDLTLPELVALIARVRSALPAGVRVTTAEVWKTWVDYPALVDAVDAVYMHAYPYWDGKPIDGAVAALAATWQQVVAVAAGKPVVIAETGWPSSGQQLGDALPSPANATRYLGEFTAWARASGIRYYYFEAFDEDWKLSDADGSVGASWGILDRDGKPKPGLQDLLRGGCSR
jgi:exo-beta-1,3-glucanase (GH17 family)